MNIDRIKELMLFEQSDSRMPFQPEQYGYKQGNPKTIGSAVKKQQEMIKTIDPKTLTMVLGVASAFIPIIGPFLSVGIGLVEAAQYQKAGDTKTAGMVAMFSLLPFVGSIVTKIPGAKQLGYKGMVALATKLTKGGGKLTQIESEVALGIANNLPLIKQEMNRYVKTVAQQSTTKQISPNAKNTLLNLGKSGLIWSAKNITPYVGAEAGYNYAWNKFNPEQSIDLANIDVKNISDVNKAAAAQLKF